MAKGNGGWEKGDGSGTNQAREGYPLDARCGYGRKSRDTSNPDNEEGPRPGEQRGEKRRNASKVVSRRLVLWMREAERIQREWEER